MFREVGVGGGKKNYGSSLVLKRGRKFPTVASILLFSFQQVTPFNGKVTALKVVAINMFWYTQ